MPLDLSTMVQGAKGTG